MNSLKIEIPKGFVVDKFDTEKGIVSFKEEPKDIKDRVKSIDDAIKVLGDIDTEVLQYLKLEEAGISGHILYNQMAVVICKALNEGWIPDWNNSEEYKYFPWFNMGSSGSGFSYDDYGYWRTSSTVGSRLCFKSRDLAEYAGKQFTEIYQKFMTI